MLREPHANHLAGVVLNSRVSTGVGHTTQICAMPGYQGRGLGRRLMEASLQALRVRGYTTVSLTVTSGNERAVRLYEKLGFVRHQEIRRRRLDRVLNLQFQIRDFTFEIKAGPD